VGVGGGFLGGPSVGFVVVDLCTVAIFVVDVVQTRGGLALFLLLVFLAHFRFVALLVSDGHSFPAASPHVLYLLCLLHPLASFLGRVCGSL